MIARVVLDIPTRSLDRPFDYLVPEGVDGADTGAPVLVPFGGRRAVGYVVGRAESSEVATDALRAVEAVLGPPLFGPHAPALAEWVAREYVAPLADSLRLFLPPGGTPRVRRGERGWELVRPAVGAVDDRWAELAPGGAETPVRAGATMQRALIDALRDGPVRVPELAAQLGSVDGALKRLADAGAVRVVRRRRMRTPGGAPRLAPRHAALSAGQRDGLDVIAAASPGSCVLLDGVTGSGKTEVYLRAIERVIAEGGQAVVLVPEISLTPQTVGRFRARFGERVAVLHSRLSPGERYDQWDLAATGEADVVVGARSALFAPLARLRLIVIDEEHESSYKQGSAPRYHARAVAERLAAAAGAVLVLGSATPSLETLQACDEGRCIRVELPERVGGGVLPAVEVVDMAVEFAEGNRSMFSRALAEGLRGVAERGEKAVLFLNRRGFAAFLLCRECGYVPRCDSCSVSLTYHEVGSRLACHHCGAGEAVPGACPRCGSPYLRQFGAGTQRVEAELRSLVPDLPVVRMDADTTAGKGAHERLLASFELLERGVLLGTQMVAKGLDYPDVTLVGVVNADTTLHLPDFRAAERTWQLLAQVSGRAGRGSRPGRVVLQTYWADHPAVLAAASHDRALLVESEREARKDLGYPPFGRLGNVTLSGRSLPAVRDAAARLGAIVAEQAPDGWRVLGPAPAALARLKGQYRWHVLVKAPPGADVAGLVGSSVRSLGAVEGVSVAPDVDPADLL